MIYLGLRTPDKLDAIAQYCDRHAIKKIVVLCPPRFRLQLDGQIPYEVVLWGESGTGPKNEIVQYKFYYRLIQEIDHSTLVVIHECLRTQNRNDLTYNCIRQFLQQTNHQLIFQYLPFIDGIEDFMTLVDFDTRSMWKRSPFSPELAANANIVLNPRVPKFQEIQVAAPTKAKAAYEKEKEKLFNALGTRDPHTLPRNLYLTTGKLKLGQVQETHQYVGRNNRFKLPNLTTYRDEVGGDRFTVFEFPHNHIEFNDFLYLSGQTHVPVLTTDLKVDQWYWGRYCDWAKRLEEAIAQIPHTPFRQEPQDASPVSQQDEECGGGGTGTHQLSLRLV